jgi:hypothetical protein
MAEDRAKDRTTTRGKRFLLAAGFGTVYGLVCLGVFALDGHTHATIFSVAVGAAMGYWCGREDGEDG